MEATFDQKKDEVLKRLEDIFRVYDEFTMNVDPKHWRSVGSHVTDMRSMHHEIKNFTEMTEDQRNDPKVQSMLESIDPLESLAS